MSRGLPRYEIAYSNLQAIAASGDMLPLTPAPAPELLFGLGSAAFRNTLTIDTAGVVDLMADHGADPAKLQALGILVSRRVCNELGQPGYGQTSLRAEPKGDHIYAPMIHMSLEACTGADGRLDVGFMNHWMLHELRHQLQRGLPWYNYMDLRIMDRGFTPARGELRDILYTISWQEAQANRFARKNSHLQFIHLGNSVP